MYVVYLTFEYEFCLSFGISCWFWLMVFVCARNEMAERMAYLGLSVNMVVFMFSVMHMPISSSTNAVNNNLSCGKFAS